MPRKAISVSQLNAYIARLLSTDGALSDISVTGEVSGFKLHQSGHVYFSLKDQVSKVNCFLPGNIYNANRDNIAEGMQITVEGYVNVYEKGGSYSITIRKLSSDGQGDLDAKFEALKKKLKDLGYFETSRKRVIPGFAKRVGIVTSNTGAAIEDMIKIISNRNTVADILIFPTLVQGEGAAEMIAERIQEACAYEPVIDVLIVGRGGGSKEDLWAFNEEVVADAIYASKIPVISAVGHESDVTIADFVADLRAETPTAAAQIAVPNTYELTEYNDALMEGMIGNVRRLYQRDMLRIRAFSPAGSINALKSGLNERRARSERLFGSIAGSVGKQRIAGSLIHIDGLKTGMSYSIRSRLERNSDRLSGRYEKLEALSPLKVLSRGYAIIEDSEGKAVISAKNLSPGDDVNAHFQDGNVSMKVGEVSANDKS